MATISERVQEVFGSYSTIAMITVIAIIIALVVLLFRTFGDNWFLWLIIAIGIIVLFFVAKGAINKAKTLMLEVENSILTRGF
ncbi:hypothetical protein D3C87_853070 [compost metagenome]